jgi:diguanylate cyclase (GGDEF)-like protein
VRAGLTPVVAIVLGVLLLVVAGASVGIERQRDTSARDASLDRVAQVDTARVESYLERAEVIARLTAVNPAFTRFTAGAVPRAERIAAQEGSAAVNNALAFLERLYPDAIGEACFIDGRGPEYARVVRGTAALPHELSPDESQAVFFAPTMALPKGGVHHSVPYRSPDTGEWVISNSSPVETADGRRLGMVHYEVTIESIRRELASIAAPGQAVRIIDDAGTVVIDSSVPQAVAAPLGVPDDATFRDVARRPHGGVIASGGEHYVVRAIPNDGDAPTWYVVASVASPSLVSTAGVTPVGIVLALLAVLLLIYGRRALTRRHRAVLDDAEMRRREAEERSRVDPLTGLLNRRGCVERLAAELSRAGRDGGAPGVLVIDADHFKRVNDTHGHRAGDEALITIARRLRETVREYDVVARWGGEEFCVVVPGTESDAELLQIGESIRAAVAGVPVAVQPGVLLRLTVSIGAVRAGEGLWSVEGIVDSADRALYAAKRRGRNQVRLFSHMTVEDFVSEEPEAIRLARVLALSASVREGMSEMHAEQVADLAGGIAEVLGLEAEMVLRCRLGGWLHDVGKVAIPDRILTKPGPLDEDEWGLMQTHATIGEEVVARLAGLAEAAAAVRHHHERVDGTGYPDGLAGEKIPLEARIVAAADVYSTMTSDRAYQRGRSKESAVQELRAAAGTHLDPAVVDALVRFLEQRERAVAIRLAG